MEFRNIKFLMVTALVSIGVCQAQLMPVNYATNQITYTGNIENSTLSEKELVKAAIGFINKHYTTLNDITLIHNETSGDFVINTATDAKILQAYKRKFAGNVTYTITLKVQDDELYYHITNFEHFTSFTNYGNGGNLIKESPDCENCLLSQKKWGFIKVDIHIQMNNLIADLQNHIAQAAIIE